ncbi:hypothetical protein Aduo_013412 [Ancylostoma duodenale]
MSDYSWANAPASLLSSFLPRQNAYQDLFQTALTNYRRVQECNNQELLSRDLDATLELACLLSEYWFGVSTETGTKIMLLDGYGIDGYNIPTSEEDVHAGI